MVDKRKIILMSKLAVYDKLMGEADRRITRYYRHDYIYRQNAVTRMCVAIVTISLIAVYWFYQIFIEGMDLYSLDYEKIALDSAKYLIIILVIYSFIGTIKTTMEYQGASRRLKRYFKALAQLDRLRIRSKDEFEEVSNSGRNAANSRNVD